MKYVKVPLNIYLNLEERNNKLSFLETCGVDSWDPGMDLEEYTQEYGSIEITEDEIDWEIIEE